MKSHNPMMASIEAAVTEATPKSAQSEMKWVWTSPLVLSPQTKKVPASTQKVRLPEASLSALSVAPKTGFAGAGGMGRPLSPYETRPRS